MQAVSDCVFCRIASALDGEVLICAQEGISSGRKSPIPLPAASQVWGMLTSRRLTEAAAVVVHVQVVLSYPANALTLCANGVHPFYH